jgi:hypothetical protein
MESISIGRCRMPVSLIYSWVGDFFDGLLDLNTESGLTKGRARQRPVFESAFIDESER